LTQNDRKDENISKNCEETKKLEEENSRKFKEEKKNIDEKSLKSLRRKPKYSLKDNLRIWYCLNLPLSKFILFFG